MPQDVRPLVTNFAEGQMFSDISSLSFLLGVSWGSCTLSVSPVDLSDSRISNDGHFGQLIRSDHDAILNQFENLSPGIQRSYFGPRQTYTKSVFGLSFGAATSGIVRMAANGLRSLVGSVASDIVDYYNDFESGFSSSCRLFRGVGHYDTKYLGNQSLSNTTISVLRFSAQAIAGVAFNLVFLNNLTPPRALIARLNALYNRIRVLYNQLTATDFSIRTILEDIARIASIPARRDEAMREITEWGLEIQQIAIDYLQYIFDSPMCWAYINEVSLGLLAPGVDLQIIGGY